ncbi:hypothetical protein [Allosaccharopolyspora coralli]|nr:hypothetical protein [Allosaccharopolyspora coralli]
MRRIIFAGMAAITIELDTRHLRRLDLELMPGQRHSEGWTKER